MGKYYLASHRWFDGIGNLSVSVDASRVGGRDLLCGILLGWKQNDYRAMVTPPQAPPSEPTRPNT